MYAALTGALRGTSLSFPVTARVTRFMAGINAFIAQPPAPLTTQQRRALMTDAPPVRRRILGAALRRFRKEAGCTLDDAARILDSRR